MPRPKIYANNAEKVAAYQKRKREERAAMIALTKRVVSGSVNANSSIEQLLEELPDSQARALKRVASSQDSVTNLKTVAG